MAAKNKIMKKKKFVAPLCREHFLGIQSPLCSSVTGGETPPFGGEDDYGSFGAESFQQLFGADGDFFL